VRGGRSENEKQGKSADFLKGEGRLIRSNVGCTEGADGDAMLGLDQKYSGFEKTRRGPREG